MRVGLVTTYAEPCGIAEYAKSLIASIPEVEFEVYDRNRWDTKILVNDSFDILHLNHSTTLFPWFTIFDVMKVKATGKKVVMTLHDSSSCNTGSFIDIWDKVIVHEKTHDDKCMRIPFGIPEMIGIDKSLKSNNTNGINALGTAGFPIEHKGFKVVAEVSALLKRDCYIIAPASRHANTDTMEQEVRRYHGETIYIKDYMPQDEVIRRLYRHAEVMVFPYTRSSCGISGAVRMGLATGKPIVLTRCQQFNDLYESYQDEIEFVESGPNVVRDVVEAVDRVLANGKKPSRLLEDMSWSKIGQQYKSMYEEVLCRS